MQTKYIVECALYNICYALYILYEYALIIVMVCIQIIMLSAFESFFYGFLLQNSFTRTCVWLLHSQWSNTDVLTCVLYRKRDL